jgi:hypothetical protein
MVYTYLYIYIYIYIYIHINIDVIMAGDDVKMKKPDPMIYNMAKSIIGMPAERYSYHYIYNSMFFTHANTYIYVYI